MDPNTDSSIGMGDVSAMELENLNVENFSKLFEEYVKKSGGCFLDLHQYSEFGNENFLIGTGNFGSVYFSNDKNNNTKCIIKQMTNSKSSRSDMVRIYKKIQAFNLLKHEQISNIRGVFLSENFHVYERNKRNDLVVYKKISGKQLFMVSDFIDGQDFSKFIEENLKDKDINLPDKIKLSLAIQMVTIIEYVHNQKILHRNIKPKNFMIAHTNLLKLVLVDFGFAKIIDGGEVVDETTGCGRTNDTLNYDPPERFCQNDKKDLIQLLKFDVWSLGGVILELYTGDKPWRKCKNDNNIIKFIGKNNLDNIYYNETINKKTSRKIERYPKIHEILDKCFEFDTEDRFTTKELLNQLLKLKK
jgi:serine/threonine protein kinase